MSGTLELSDKLCWMPAGWVYDEALERLAAELEAGQPSTSRILRQARTEENGGYLDLRSARTDELVALHRAAEDVYVRLKSEGVARFSAPEFYVGFVSQVLTLKEMLRDRLREPSPEQRGSNMAVRR